MARTARPLSASGVYHLIWRGIDRQQLFHDDADCIQSKARPGLRH